MDDIKSREDLRLLVEKFFNKARKDEHLGSVFASAVDDDHWPQHFERVTDFWNSALFDANSYRGSTFSKHADLPIEKKHFDRWLHLFSETVNEYFSGPMAEDCIKRAITMGLLFESKISYLRSNTQLRSIV